MSAPKQELTPEEKLLALIQQDKPKGGTPVAPSSNPEQATRVVPSSALPAPSAPIKPRESPVAVPAPPAPIKPQVAPVAAPVQPVAKVEPVPDKKLRLAVEAATLVPASTDKPIVEKKADLPKGVQDSSGKQGKGDAAPSGKEERGPAKHIASAAEVPAQPVPARSPVIMRPDGLVLANRVLALVVLVLLVLVVYSVASMRADVAGEIARQVSGAGRSPLDPLVVTSQEILPFDFYREKVIRRNVFVPGGGQPTTNPPPIVVRKVEDLKLVGISLDTATPEESLAIIRSKLDSRMHFVKLGQTVGETEFTLERVLSDRVILKSNKTEFELK